MAEYELSFTEVQEGIYASIRMDKTTGKVDIKYPGEAKWRKTDIIAVSIEQAEEMVTNSHK